MLAIAPVIPPDRFAHPHSPVSEGPIGMLAYRSRALVPPTEGELEVLLRCAQQRNRTEGLTGLLIYDQGCFFQWLEGPAAGLARIWASIGRDPRHHDIQILRQQELPRRFFGSWDLRLTSRQRSALEIGGPSPAGVVHVAWPPRAVPALSIAVWDDVFAELVLPKLVARHRALPARAAPAALRWHAVEGAPDRLARLLLRVDAAATAEYVDELVAQGAGLDALYREVFEPAARCLGGLWDDDHMSELDVTLGLIRLQLEARRLGATLAGPRPATRPGHAVLVTPQPGESHGLNAAMSSMLFSRDGWDVSCEFPNSDQRLSQLVHDRWYDVLDLSLSGTFRRERQWKAMGTTIRAAQAASRNPALAVVVDGRLFFERPDAYFDVGADAGCASVVESVGAAQRLLDDLASQRRIEQSMIDRPRRTWPDRDAEAASLRLFERRFKSTVF